MPMPVFQGDPERIIPKLMELRELNVKKVAAEKKFNELKKKHIIMEEQIFLLMEADDVQSVNIDGQTFYRRLDRYFSINNENKEAACKWLKSVGFGELFQETINARTLTAEMKNRINEDDLKVPDEYIHMKIAKRVGIKRR